MASITSRVVEGLRVVGDPLIPDKHGTSVISHSTLEILTLRNVVKEEVEKIVGLFPIEAHNVLGVYWVHVQSFLLGDRMHDDHRVFLPQLGPPHDRSVAMLHLLRDTVVVGVDRGQAFEPFPEPW